jgi:predicted RNA-binding Zn ribbon-like protein
MNTIWADQTGVHDALKSRVELSSWLAAVGDRLFAAGESVTRPARQGELDDFRELRTALRVLAAAVTEDARPAALASIEGRSPASAARLLNTLSAAAPPIPRLRWPEQKAELTPPTGARAPVVAMSAVAGAAVQLLDESRGHLLRACQAPGCVLYFVKDHPRREWCSPSCGNRARAARFYQRHRATPTTR